MCGRYGLYDVSESEFLKDNTGYTFKPNYNVAPTHLMPIITNDTGSQALTVMQWGIGRRIGPDVEKDIFNTRSEKAMDRFWGKTVRTNRCLIPANGFYEWRKSDNGKIPYWIHSPVSNLIYFAGIFDTDKQRNPHYSIMTTSPNHEMESIHNRMPVILLKDAQEVWLGADESEIEILADLLTPLPDNSLEMFEVSREVNMVRNNYGGLIKPLNPK